MKSFAVVAMCCAGAQAFVPVPKGSIGVGTAPRVQSPSTVMMAKSKSLPFLEQPAALDGTMPGDVGFDPLGLTENINLPYAAEIKHGRVSMLAVVGFLLTQYVHLPAEQFQVGPLEAVTSLPLGVHVQVFSFIAVFEAASIFTTFSDNKDPWELLVQDPAGAKGFYKKDAAEQERLKLSEIQHCRLAMLAITGELVQMMLYHKATPVADQAQAFTLGVVRSAMEFGCRTLVVSGPWAIPSVILVDATAIVYSRFAAIDTTTAFNLH